MLNNSSARAHLNAKIPTNMNQEGNMATMPLKSHRSLVKKAEVSSDCSIYIKGQKTSDCWMPSHNRDV